MAAKKPICLYNGVLQELSDGDSITHVHPDTEVNLSSVIGTPSNSTIWDLIQVTGSVSRVNGGGDITDDTDGTVTVAAGAGFIRATDSDTATLLSFDWSQTPLTPTDNSLNFIYIEYNAGTPQVVITTTKRTDENTNLYLGAVYRAGTSLHITNHRTPSGNIASRLTKRFNDTHGLTHATGSILTETGTRNLDVTAGTWWHGLDEDSIVAFDTSVSDTFVRFYSNGAGGWTVDATETQIDNLNYDDGSGTLAALSANRYGVHWVYVGVDDEIYVIYGTGNYTASQWPTAPTPPTLPPHMQEQHAALIARVVVQQNATNFTDIAIAFETSFSSAGVTDHGELAGLADDDHTQYHNDTRGDARYSILAHVHEGTEIDATAITDGFVLTADGAGNSVWEAAAGGGVFAEDAHDNLIGGIGAGASLATNGSAYDNVIAGQACAGNILTATDCVFIGDSCLDSPGLTAGTTAVGLTAIGSFAMGGHVTSGKVVPGEYSSAYGYFSMKSTKGKWNAAFGAYTLAGANSQVDASENCVFGYKCLDSVTGAGVHQNVIMGVEACNTTSGGTGDIRENVVIGPYVKLGQNAENNVILGGYAAQKLYTGCDGNIVIGHTAGPVTANPSNQIFIHNFETDTPLIHGNMGATPAASLLTINGDLTINHSATAKTSFAAGYMALTSDYPGIQMVSTDAGTVTGADLVVLTDDGAVNRVGIWASMDHTNADFTDYMVITQKNTSNSATGTFKFKDGIFTPSGGIVSLGDVTISNTGPNLTIIETDAAVDEGHYDFFVSGGILRLRAINDAVSVANDVFVVTRTAAVVDQFEIKATTTLVTGDLNATGGVDKLRSATTAVSVAAATAPSTDQVLTATSSTTATWQTPSAGASFKGALAYVGTSLTSFTTGTVNMSSESYDTDGFHSTVTNTSRMTIPAGVTKVQISASIRTTGSMEGQLYLMKNGVAHSWPGVPSCAESDGGSGQHDAFSLISGVVPVTTNDYFEVYVAFVGTETIEANNSWICLEVKE